MNRNAPDGAPIEIHVIDDRQTTHGEYAENALVAQSIKAAMRRGKNWGSNLSNTQRESLDLIATKLGRILAGDHNYKDHWIDIAGYAQLVAQELGA